MKSYQDMLLLQNLYRLKAIGYDYIDPIVVNRRDDQMLPGRVDELHAMISRCHLCDLSKSRRQSMGGFGNPDAELMFVDAYVSMAEDESGAYYTGRSGASLKKMIENVLQMPAESVYLTHAVKCRTLGSKIPSASEWNSCKSYLFRQIELIGPKLIVALGPDAYALLTGDESPFEQIRGQKIAYGDYDVMALYHPAFLLRNPSLKQAAYRDLLAVKSALEEKARGRASG